MPAKRLNFQLYAVHGVGILTAYCVLQQQLGDLYRLLAGASILEQEIRTHVFEFYPLQAGLAQCGGARYDNWCSLNYGTRGMSLEMQTVQGCK
jgi:hypothetical protein